MGQFDQGLDVLEGRLGGGREEAVIADFHEAFGQYVLEETADELQRIEREGSQTDAAGFFVGEGDSVFLDLEDAVPLGD